MTKHPLAQFLSVLALIAALICVILCQIPPLLVFLGFVWLGTCAMILNGYAIHLAGREADRAWRARNPQPQRTSPRRADLENYSVRTDGGAERITV